MTNLYFSNNTEDLQAWDELLLRDPRGLYNQYSDWIAAYRSYGFETGFLFCKDGDSIVGGAGYVIAKFAFFRFMIVPCGPVLVPGYEHQIDPIIKSLREKAAAERCCYFQISLPLLKTTGPDGGFALADLHSESVFFTGAPGTRFKHVIPLYGMRVVDLAGKSHDEVRKGYSSNHLRNVKKAEKNQLNFRWLTEAETDNLRTAYSCFEKNAADKGYPIRSYDAVRDTLHQYLKKGYAKIGVCEEAGHILGALYVMVCGGRYIYINGGVFKEYQDKGVSHFMHDQAMRDALSHQHPHYDISVGGSTGVMKFKEGFGSRLILFEEPRHWVLNRPVFALYAVVENLLKKQKARIAKWLERR